MKRTLIALSLACLAAPAVAQEAAPPSPQDRCAPLDRVEAMLAAEFRESRVQQGIVGDGNSMLLIYASPNGETWSAVVVRSDGVGCLASAGSDWTARHDPAPASEEGL
jgi:hypothetical protein